MRKLQKELTEMTDYAKRHTEQEFLTRYTGYDLIKCVHVFWNVYGHPLPVEYR